jgi:hypothetical protein
LVKSAWRLYGWKNGWCNFFSCDVTSVE